LCFTCPIFDKYFIEQGLNIHTDNDRTLQISVENGHIVARYLVSQGVNVNILDAETRSKHNFDFEHLEIVQYLVDHGVDIHEESMHSILAPLTDT
jgi:hypothetical protein